MLKKYHITPKPTAPRFIPVGRSGIIDWEEDCMKCVQCVKKRCLYDVYKCRTYDAGIMVDSIDYTCKNCFSCIQNCPRAVLGKTLNPEFLKMGDEYYKPEIILSTWSQAENGKVPVSGAGYRGPFSGPGFDSMWTDMSEIVRPTRDGIHGREYISTAIDMGRKKDRLEFDAAGNPITDIPPLVEIPIPVLFNVLPFGNLSPQVTQSITEAAKRVGTMAYITKDLYSDRLGQKFKAHLIPLLTVEDVPSSERMIEGAPMVELWYSADAWDCAVELKRKYPQMVISFRVPLDSGSKWITSVLAKAGAEIIHLYADYKGNEIDAVPPRFVKDMVRSIHQYLVAEAIRDEVTILVSGGIALAEHLPKIIICGADGAVIDLPLLIALECRVCDRCRKGKSCPVAIENVSVDFGANRIVNLMSSWWSQLIEVMGAMGIRDVRRIRGEAGRAMFFEDLEKETFGALFGRRIR